MYMYSVTVGCVNTILSVHVELSIPTAQLLMVCARMSAYVVDCKQECFTLAFPSGTMHFDAMSSLGGSSYIDTSLMPLAGSSALTCHVHAVYSMHADDIDDDHDGVTNNSDSGSDDEHRPAKTFKRASV
jgi:hypothetical protein